MEICQSLPPPCATVVVNGLAYQQCGSTWYQPRFSGTTTAYFVVNAPRRASKFGSSFVEEIDLAL
jgi:hypothetical protein